MILVVDYGAGNVGSVLNMIKKAGGQAMTSNKPIDVLNAQKIVLPGVGSFDNAIKKLEELQLIAPLRDKARSGTPFLGICLGMQLLASRSEEGTREGLNLISGEVRRFQFEKENLRVPHMGWNVVNLCKSTVLTAHLESDARFYFVHSYHFECEEKSHELFHTHYGYEFTSGVQCDNIIGVQFHPEKSHRFGMQLFKNFIGI